MKAAPVRPPDLFFNRFRTSLARLPAGLIRVGGPADPADLARVESDLTGAPLPEAYVALVRSFDGVDLFHESVIVAGVGAGSFRPLATLVQPGTDELVFAENSDGERFLLDRAGQVLRAAADGGERSLAGTSLDRWLDATIAHEQVLFGPDGEYAPELFDPSGEEILPLVALRQAERALKADPGAADSAHARGLALLRLGRVPEALAALTEAANRSPDTPSFWFDLGHSARAHGDGAVARRAFAQAAVAAVKADSPAAGRIHAWAALTTDDPEAAALNRREALARDKGLVESLRRAVEAAREDGDDEGYAEARALLVAVAPDAAPPARPRLPVLNAGPVSAPAARPPRSPRPPRPRPAAPPRSGGSRRGRSR